MPAPPGYIRSRTTRDRELDTIWQLLRRLYRTRKPVSATDLAERVGCSRSTVKRLLQAARDQGWVETASVDTVPTITGAALIPHYRLTATAPRDAPVLRIGKHYTAIPPGSVPGSALAALRHANGWSVAEASRQWGIDDRTIRRYELLPALPQEFAERVGLTP